MLPFLLGFAATAAGYAIYTREKNNELENARAEYERARRENEANLDMEMAMSLEEIIDSQITLRNYTIFLTKIHTAFVIHEEIKYRLKKYDRKLNEVNTAISKNEEELSYTSEEMKNAERDKEKIENIFLKMALKKIQEVLSILPKTIQLAEESKKSIESLKTNINKLENEKSKIRKATSNLECVKARGPLVINEICEEFGLNWQQKCAIVSLIEGDEKQLNKFMSQTLTGQLGLSTNEVSEFNNFLDNSKKDIIRKMDKDETR